MKNGYVLSLTIMPHGIINIINFFILLFLLYFVYITLNINRKIINILDTYIYR